MIKTNTDSRTKAATDSKKQRQQIISNCSIDNMLDRPKTQAELDKNEGPMEKRMQSKIMSN